MKTVYIAGPVTGRPNLNEHTFRVVENALRSMRKPPIVPHDLVHKSCNHTQAMHTCLGLLTNPATRPDEIVVLPGWEKSEGTMMEIQLADNLGLPITFLSHLDIVKMQHA